VHYFTAAVDGPGRPRQDTYLRALQAHSPELTVHLGRYVRKTVNCRARGTTWVTHEEKESDVALGPGRLRRLCTSRGSLLDRHATRLETLPGQHHWRVRPAR
jgi:hypothetical protein